MTISAALQFLPLCDVIPCQSQENWAWNEVHLIIITKPVVIVLVREECVWVSG